MLVTLAVSIACAGTRPRILLVRSASAEPQLAHRLQVEFTNLGIDVVEVPDEAGSNPAGLLTEAAKREQAFAAVRVVSEVGGVTVWVADRLTNKTLVRTLTAGTGQIGGEVVALEVVELLRASLLELKVEPSRAVPPSEVGNLLVPDDRGERRAAASRVSRLHLEIAPAVLFDPGGIGPTGHADVGLRYDWLSHWSSRAFVLLPVVRGKVRGPEGAADVGVGLVGIGLELAPGDPTAEWSFRAGIGIGVARLQTEGSTASALLERVDAIYTALPFATAMVERRLGARVGVGLRGLTGVSLPRAVVLFGDRQVAVWGRPLLGASLVLNLALD